jgi:hypothetical protein
MPHLSHEENEEEAGKYAARPSKGGGDYWVVLQWQQGRLLIARLNLSGFSITY